MCTAVTYKTKGFYFGRTLDFEFLYPCEAVLTPRNYPFSFGVQKETANRYAILGMAYVKDGYPLYFDAFNEEGLCMAGLNFVGNAVYQKEKKNRTNIASYEFIPYILGNCKSTQEAKSLLQNINITDTAFDETLVPAQLHWMIADKDGAITVEALEEGLRVYDNPAGVLTNNPPFERQLENLKKYEKLTPLQSELLQDKMSEESSYTRGTGAVGLPGDYTSQSRFVRAAFVRRYSHSDQTEEASVNQFFHILASVSVPEGCCVVESGEFDKTLYSACMSADEKAYYYKSYESHCIRKVCMKNEDKDKRELVRFPFKRFGSIIDEN